MSRRMCPDPPPPWVQKGAIRLPESSARSRKAATGGAGGAPPVGGADEKQVIARQIGRLRLQGRAEAGLQLRRAWFTTVV